MIIVEENKSNSIHSTTVGWVCSGIPSHARTCLNLSRGDFGRFEVGMVTLKIVQNERLIEF